MIAKYAEQHFVKGEILIAILSVSKPSKEP